MYFGVKLRDFEGFLILTRKPPGQLNFSKFYKILDRGSRGGPNTFFCSWMGLVVKFSDKNEEFLCSSEREFPKFFKTHPTFVSRPLLVPSMAHQTLSSVFFGTPCSKLQKQLWKCKSLTASNLSSSQDPSKCLLNQP